MPMPSVGFGQETYVPQIHAQNGGACLVDHFSSPQDGAIATEHDCELAALSWGVAVSNLNALEPNEVHVLALVGQNPHAEPLLNQ